MRNSESPLTYKYRSQFKKLCKSVGDSHQIRTMPMGLSSNKWCVFEPKRRKMLDAFWKIHLTVHPSELDKMFHVAMVCLLPSKATFKLPASFDSYLSMNDAGMHAAQLGKIVTIYPRDEQQLIELIDVIDKEWRLSKGPRIASDLYADPESVCSIRYGEVGKAEPIKDEVGRAVAHVKTPEGKLVPDRRSEFGELPWGGRTAIICGKTFSALNLSLPTALLIAGRELKIIRASGFWYKTVALACDQDGNEYCLRRAHEGACATADGSTADMRLQREYHILKSLHRKNKDYLNKLHYCESKRSVFLLSPWLRGEAISILKVPDRLKILPIIIDEITKLHQSGFVHRDIKPSNILFDPAIEKVSLIDFELSGRLGEENQIIAGTLGYRPPEYKCRDNKASKAYDVYSLAALSAQLLGGVSPSFQRMSKRLVKIALAANGNAELAPFILQGINVNSNRRVRCKTLQRAILKHKPKSILLPTWSQTQRRQLLSTIVNACKSTRALRIQTQNGYTWKSKHPHAPWNDLSINTGSSGTIIGLLKVREYLAINQFDSDIFKGLAEIQNLDPSKHVSGLFVGMAGAAVALAFAAKQFESSDYAEMARAIMSKHILKVTDPDLFFGSAGVVLASAICSSLLNDSSFLKITSTQVMELVNTAYEHEGLVCWIPSGNLDGSRIPKTSVSHGSIGISLAIGVWASASSAAEKFRELAEQALLSLPRLCRTKQLNAFPEVVLSHSALTPNHIWCRGVSGYLWALVRARNFIRNQQEFTENLQWGAELLLKEPIGGNTTVCHGLAGQLDLLLDLIACDILPRPALEQRARWIVKLLVAGQTGSLEGNKTWCSEHSNWYSAGLWVGFMGTAKVLSRWFAYEERNQAWCDNLKTIF